jgi:hypothetical protein
MSTPPNICYVEFDAAVGKQYAYYCGALVPEVGKFVVILVGGDREKKKIVKCVALGDSDPKATATLFGIIQEQPTNVNL